MKDCNYKQKIERWISKVSKAVSEYIEIKMKKSSQYKRELYFNSDIKFNREKKHTKPGANKKFRERER